MSTDMRRPAESETDTVTDTDVDSGSMGVR
jgi:hypothetical protein